MKHSPYNGSKFYNGNEMLSHNAQYNIVISERNNGKSFWYNQKCVCDFFNDNIQFAYVKRYNDEVKNMKVDKYFQDVNFLKWLKTTYDLDGILSDRDNLYFYNLVKGKRVKELQYGNYFSLQRDEEYKSLHYDEIGNIMWEEFIQKERPYLSNEYKRFSGLVSTIARGRNVNCYLLGNTIARDCPVLLEYGIDIFKVKQNEIIIINHRSSNGTVKVAFHYAPQKSTSSMFFGKAEKAIVAGEWDVDEQPHLFCDFKEVEKIYTFYVITKLRQAFKCVLFVHPDYIGRYVYVYPFDYDEIEYTLGDDIFTDTFTVKDNYYMHPKRKRHEQLNELYKTDRFVFATDICGTEFKRAIRNYNPFV